MTAETLIVFGILLVAIVLFLSNRIRLDLVAILVIATLMLTGLLSPRQALSGFGDPLVILIAGLFVIGEGLVRTGLAHAVGQWLMEVSGRSENRLLVLLMVVVAVLSAFMSSTGAVAIFIPVVLGLAAKTRINPSRLMMPMAFASLIGGMLTLIGTPPNLIVSNQLENGGLEPFGFFSFTPIGLLVLLLGIAYMILAGRRLLPQASKDINPHQSRPTLNDLVQLFGLTGRLRFLRIAEGSAYAGQSLIESRLRTHFAATVIGIERKQTLKPVVMPALPHSRMEAGDILIAVMPPAEVVGDNDINGLQFIEPDANRLNIVAKELGLAEILLPPRSELIGRTLAEVKFREHHGVNVLGVIRKNKSIVDDLTHLRLKFGDSLLIGGHWHQIRILKEERSNFVALSLPEEMDEAVPVQHKSPLALVIILGMLVLMTFNVLPAVTAVILAALAMVFTRCIRMKGVYAAINWQSLVLIAGMLPMATALEQTGGIDLIVNALIENLGPMGPTAVMAGLFILTSLFSQFISNTATTVLVAPIAMSAAEAMSVSPYPFLMTVAIAASTAFATPVASPVNTLVLGPGGYRFTDFIKIGVPLQLMIMILVLLVVPLVFPLINPL
jgi:di/tricarboxylate transporter